MPLSSVWSLHWSLDQLTHITDSACSRHKQIHTVDFGGAWETAEVVRLRPRLHNNSDVQTAAEQHWKYYCPGYKNTKVRDKQSLQMSMVTMIGHVLVIVLSRCQHVIITIILITSLSHSCQELIMSTSHTCYVLVTFPSCPCHIHIMQLSYHRHEPITSP